MAKRALRRPDLPPGRRLDLFLYLQNSVVLCGDASTQDIAAEIGISHQTVWKALTGPRVPSWRTVEWLSVYLDRKRPKSPSHLDEATTLYRAAVIEQRDEPASRPDATPVRPAPVTNRDAASQLAAELADLVRNSGATYRQLAARSASPAGTGRRLAASTLSDMVRGKHLPSASALEALLQVVDAPRERRSQLLWLLDQARRFDNR